MNNIISQPLSFDNNNIRFTIENGTTYYSVIDVVSTLSDSPQPSRYWVDLKNQYNQLFGKSEQLKLRSSDGKKYLTDCATRENLFFIIQYIPSPLAKPFKEWLARVGEEKLVSIEKSSEQKWIETREEGKIVRKQLTSNLVQHGIRPDEIPLTTNTLYRYGLEHTAASLRKHKGLKDGTNVRNHMNRLELLVTKSMETVLDEIMGMNHSYGYRMVNEDAIEAGEFGARMRRDIERMTGRPVVSKENNLSPKKKLDTKKDKQLAIE